MKYKIIIKVFSLFLYLSCEKETEFDMYIVL